MRAFVHAVAITILSASAAVLAQQPTILHGQATTEAVDHELNAALDGLKRQNSAMWVGYSIPVTSKFSSGWNSGNIAYLEGNSDSTVNDSEKSNPSSDHAFILLRIADAALMKLRVESPERQLDAGGLRFVWLTGVNVDDSVRVLTDVARQGDARHLRIRAARGRAVQTAEY